MVVVVTATFGSVHLVCGVCDIRCGFSCAPMVMPVCTVAVIDTDVILHGPSRVFCFSFVSSMAKHSHGPLRSWRTVFQFLC